MLMNSQILALRKLFPPISYNRRALASKVPSKPVSFKSAKLSQVSVSREEILLLERLSLVKCDTEAGVRVLEDAIAFADKVLRFPVDGVVPMQTVLENENLSLREDKVTEGDCQKEILRNAAVKEEDYFVAPPGNIPLQANTDSEIQTKTQKIKK